MNRLCQNKSHVSYLLIILLGFYNHPAMQQASGYLHVDRHFTHSLIMTTVKLKPSRNMLLFVVFLLCY